MTKADIEKSVGDLVVSRMPISAKIESGLTPQELEAVKHIAGAFAIKAMLFSGADMAGLTEEDAWAIYDDVMDYALFQLNGHTKKEAKTPPKRKRNVPETTIKIPPPPLKDPETKSPAEHDAVLERMCGEVEAIRKMVAEALYGAG